MVSLAKGATSDLSDVVPSTINSKSVKENAKASESIGFDSAIRTVLVIDPDLYDTGIFNSEMKTTS